MTVSHTDPELVEAFFTRLLERAQQPDEVLSQDAYAKALELAPRTLRRKIAEGELPGRIVGGKAMVTRLLLEAWFREPTPALEPETPPGPPPLSGSRRSGPTRRIAASPGDLRPDDLRERQLLGLEPPPEPSGRRRGA